MTKTLSTLLILTWCFSTAFAVEYGEYPEGIREVVYFASGGGWGDPDHQPRFVSIKATEDSFETKNGTYADLDDLLSAEELSDFEGVAVECRHCYAYSGGNDAQREIEAALQSAGISEIIIWPSTEWSEARRIFLDRTTGKVVGTITAAENDEPLQWAYVSSRFFGGDSDENGNYEVDLLDPGQVRLVASRRDRESVVVEIEVVAGKTTHHNFSLPLAKPACCKLEGVWKIELTLTDDRRPDEYKPETVAESVSGQVVFSSEIANPLGSRGSRELDGILDEFGVYGIDLTPFFGENITASISNTVYGGSNDPDPLTQAAGSISHFDKVGISFIPRMSHGGISLFGTIVDDSEITGEWHKRDYAVVMSGTFVMRRVEAE